MENEKTLAVEIGGYRRYIPESKLPQLKADIEAMIERYVSLGMPREIVEPMYTLVVFRDEQHKK